jgi:hypothetical protein
MALLVMNCFWSFVVVASHLVMTFVIDNYGR